MKQIKVNFHSIVDVITNSSTTIYVQCTNSTIKYAKDLINDILKVAKSDKAAEDLFEFKIVADKENTVEQISDDLVDYLEYKENIKNFVSKLGYTKEDINSDDCEKHEEIAEKIYNAITNNEIEEPDGWGSDDCDGYDMRNLIITAKDEDKFIMDLGNRLCSIFDVDGCMG